MAGKETMKDINVDVCEEPLPLEPTADFTGKNLLGKINGSLKLG